MCQSGCFIRKSYCLTQTFSTTTVDSHKKCFTDDRRIVVILRFFFMNQGSDGFLLLRSDENHSILLKKQSFLRCQRLNPWGGFCPWKSRQNRGLPCFSMGYLKRGWSRDIFCYTGRSFVSNPHNFFSGSVGIVLLNRKEWRNWNPLHSEPPPSLGTGLQLD